MIRFLAVVLLTVSFNALAQPQIDDLSKEDVRNIANEIAVNFYHTTVSAPETEGLWGIEVGVTGGKTNAPQLKDTVDENGGDGSDYKQIPHGGLFARAHFPFDVFVEATVIPSLKVDGLAITNKTLGVGWNFGGFFEWPLDVAFGINVSKSKLEFDQSLASGAVDATVSFDGETRNVWIGASKTFIGILTPYVKMGFFRTQSDIQVDGKGTIFAYTNKQEESVDETGGYFAMGLNAQFLFMKAGFEVMRANRVGSGTAKLSVDF